MKNEAAYIIYLNYFWFCGYFYFFISGHSDAMHSKFKSKYSANSHLIHKSLKVRDLPLNFFKSGTARLQTINCERPFVFRTSPHPHSRCGEPAWWLFCLFMYVRNNTILAGVIPKFVSDFEFWIRSFDHNVSKLEFHIRHFRLTFLNSK